MNKSFLGINSVLLLLSFLLTIVFSLMTNIDICGKFENGKLCGPPDLSKANENQYCINAKKVSTNSKNYNSAKNLNLFVFAITLITFLISIVMFFIALKNDQIELLDMGVFAFVIIISFIVLICWGHYFNNCFNINYKCIVDLSDKKKSDDGKSIISTPKCKAKIIKKFGKFSYERGIKAKKNMSVINTLVLVAIYIFVLHQFQIPNDSTPTLIINGLYYLGYFISVIIYLAYQGNKKITNLKIAGFAFIILYLLASVLFFN